MSHKDRSQMKVASLRAAELRSANAAAGLLRIDGEIVITADAAKELRCKPSTLRQAVAAGMKTREALRKWIKAGASRYSLENFGQ